jgi:hypothetical protein
MLSNVYSSDEWLQSVGGSNLPYIPSNTNPLQGMVRITNSTMEVFNVAGWTNVGGGAAHIGMTQRAREIMRWAEEKMNTEKDIMKAIKTSPAVADAYQALKEAEEKLLVVMTLSQEESK